jgi:hypothetical protein
MGTFDRASLRSPLNRGGPGSGTIGPSQDCRYFVCNELVTHHTRSAFTVPEAHVRSCEPLPSTTILNRSVRKLLDKPRYGRDRVGRGHSLTGSLSFRQQIMSLSLPPAAIPNSGTFGRSPGRVGARADRLLYTISVNSNICLFRTRRHAESVAHASGSDGRSVTLSPSLTLPARMEGGTRTNPRHSGSARS